MIHSGSRNLGYKIAKYYHDVAKELCSLWHTDLPDKDLSFLPRRTDEGEQYWQSMNIAMRFAKYSRKEMMYKVLASIGTFFPHFIADQEYLDVHHNYADIENHNGKNYMIHRKGAVRARLGEKVIIPGSMGSVSFICEGLGNSDSFNSCSHGAGRKMGRKEAKRTFQTETVLNDMAEKGIELSSPSKGDIADESVFAYKDIEEVIHRESDLVVPIKKLWPIGVGKG